MNVYYVYNVGPDSRHSVVLCSLTPECLIKRVTTRLCTGFGNRRWGRAFLICTLTQFRCTLPCPAMYFIRQFLRYGITAVLVQSRISMSRFYAFVALASLVIAVSATRPKYKSAPTTNSRDNSGTTCYTNTGATGSYMDYFDYASSLGSFDNSFRSCCLYGIWMWYDLQDFNYVDFNVNISHVYFLPYALMQRNLKFAATSLLCVGWIWLLGLSKRLLEYSFIPEIFWSSRWVSIRHNQLLWRTLLHGRRALLLQWCTFFYQG